MDVFQASGEMTEAEPSADAQKTPKALILGGVHMSEGQARAASRTRDMVLLGIGISAVARLLRSRRFQVRVITGVIGVAALAGMARESEVPVMVRVIFKDYFTGHVKELMEHGQEELKREELKREELKRRHRRSSTTGPARKPGQR
jgi:hypothetical protein